MLPFVFSSYNMRRLIISALFALVIIPSILSRTIDRPDFAFPKKAKTESLASLDKALSAGDKDRALRALLNYSISEMQLGSAGIPAVISKIDSVGTMIHDPSFSSLMDLLKATLYKDIYFSSTWIYDQRELPLEPLPADCSEWSGLQFRAVILNLIDSALTARDQLKAERLSSYPLSIIQDSRMRVYYPTLYDFVANVSIRILESFNTSRSPGMPFSVLEQALTPAPLKFNSFYSSDPVREKILTLYSSLISVVSPVSAPSVNALVGRLNYILPDIVDPYSGQSFNRLTAYLDLYKNLCDSAGKPLSEYAGDVLVDAPHTDEIYVYIKDFLTAFPEYWRADCLKNTMASLTAKSIEVSGPSLVPIGKKVNLKINLKNVTAATLAVYDVSSLPIYKQEVDVNGKNGISGTRIASIPVNSSIKTVPFSENVSVEYSFPVKGNYIIVPEISGVPLHNGSFMKIHASSVVLIPTRFDKYTVWAVDASTGEPLENVYLTLYNNIYSRNVGSFPVGKTDSEGYARITKHDNGMITASYNDDRFTTPVFYFDYNYTRPDKWLPGTIGFPSLPIYHPGDTARWVLVSYEYKGGLQRIVSGSEIKAVLYNATSTPIDTITGITDNYGRLTGEFVLPTDGLTGRYSVNVDGQWNVFSFEVSDYKLPSYMIETDPVEKGVPAPGDVSVRGVVKTYSGFAIADTEITLRLSVVNTPWWWRRATPFQFYTAKVRTDSEGRFSFPLLKDVFALSPLARGYYTAELTAVSQSGETRSATLSFTLGTRYMIKASVPGNIDISSGLVNFDVKAVDSNDSVVNEPIILSIFRGEKKIRSGLLTTPEDLSGLESGKYSLVFSLNDPSLADSVKMESVLYNPSDSLTPVPGTLFWSPDSKLTADRNGSATFLYATDAESHLLLSLTTRDSLLYTRWVKSPAGMHRLNFSIPDSVEEAHLNLLCTGDYRQMSHSFSVTRDNSRKGIRIITETFRDRIAPGSNETWTFRIESLDGKGTEAAVITDLYNKALDAVASSSGWNLRLNESYGPRWSWESLTLNDKFFSHRHSERKFLECPSLQDLAFQTYGYSLRPGGGARYFRNISLRGAGSVMMKSMATDMSLSKDEMVEEEAEFSSADSDGIAVANDAGTGGTVEKGDISQVDNTSTYRVGEVPLAFFRPSLTTDSLGHLSLSFTVPDANTTWGFRALAFTKSLLNSSLSADIIASKAIMVEPNLPRFLREGDDIVLKASVMNNSDSGKYIESVVEMFNPADNTVILTHSQSDSLMPGSYALVSVSFRVPSGINLIGYRIKSNDDCNRDGEQTVLPVLSTITPVIESTPFYMPADQHVYETQLPVPPGEGRVSLSFCENPAWYVVTALPSLIEKESSTAPQAAQAIYSAALSIGLLNDNPSIAEALKMWAASDKSSDVLVSMLEKNNDLKYLLLSATPWISDAGDDTERMTRLSLYFDRKLTESVLTRNIEILDKLQSADGGWCWSRAYSAYSFWSTRQVLSLLGQLNNMGYLPESKKLNSMITKALMRDRLEIEKQFRRYPDGDYSSCIVIHDMFRSFPESKIPQNIIDRTTQRILKDWRNVSIPVKSLYARILFMNDYQNSAKEILASLREFAASDSRKGMWFPQLDTKWYDSWSKTGITADILETFAMIEPQCPDIDLLRQWLILQKGANNWGNGVNASKVVGAILSTSGRWFVPSSGSRITIGGKKVESTPSDRLLGDINLAIPSSLFGKKLKIERKGDTPSWGSVYSIYQAEMTEIPPASCEELSIQKALYQFPDSTGKAVTLPKQFSLGAKVRVTLTIKVKTDMDYIMIIDERPACFEPVQQLSRWIYSDGLGFYLENRDAETRLFIDHLPVGTYVLSYEMWVNNEGKFTSGLAKIQSQYAPQFSAHSSGSRISVE